ncbi:hypothetical protein AS032_26285 [Rhodococcus qingshengii]|nr:hypothetical protein AS032_26285 [Rhodococcus qingshengii]
MRVDWTAPPATDSLPHLESAAADVTRSLCLCAFPRPEQIAERVNATQTAFSELHLKAGVLVRPLAHATSCLGGLLSESSTNAWNETAD